MSGPIANGTRNEVEDPSLRKLKSEIRKIQVGRRLARQQHQQEMRPLQRRLNEAKTALRKKTPCQMRSQQCIYQETVEEVLGPCRDEEEIRLLQASHTVEVHERQLELTIQQYRRLTDYMVCELNVLESEIKEIKSEHSARYSLVAEEMTKFTDSFSTPPVQRRRSSCCGRASTLSRKSGGTAPSRRRNSLFFTAAGDDDDCMSVMSDLSLSVASQVSCAAAKSLETEDTCSTAESVDFASLKQPGFIPEEEKFTVIKL